MKKQLHQLRRSKITNEFYKINPVDGLGLVEECRKHAARLSKKEKHVFQQIVKEGLALGYT